MKSDPQKWQFTFTGKFEPAPDFHRMWEHLQKDRAESVKFPCAGDNDCPVCKMHKTTYTIEEKIFTTAADKEFVSRGDFPQDLLKSFWERLRKLHEEAFMFGLRSELSYCYKCRKLFTATTQDPSKDYILKICSCGAVEIVWKY